MCGELPAGDRHTSNLKMVHSVHSVCLYIPSLQTVDSVYKPFRAMGSAPYNDPFYDHKGTIPAVILRTSSQCVVNYQLETTVLQT